MTHEGGVGMRGGNVRSVEEARQLQTESRDLDRWRLVMEVQIHRTLLGTGRFHVDDLDCLDLPAEAFAVRGTLVNAVRASGVMRYTGVERKIAHKAANARKGRIYEITEKGRSELPKIVGSSSGVPGGSSTARSGDIGPGVGSPAGSDKSGAAPPPTVAADTGSPDHPLFPGDAGGFRELSGPLPRQPQCAIYDDVWEDGEAA